MAFRKSSNKLATLRNPSERKFDIEEVKTTTPDFLRRGARSIRMMSGILVLADIRLFKDEAELLRDFLIEMIDNWKDIA